MANGRWVQSDDDKCPKCGELLELYVEKGYDDLGNEQDYVNAEKCPNGCWFKRFTE